VRAMRNMFGWGRGLGAAAARYVVYSWPDDMWRHAARSGDRARETTAPGVAPPRRWWPVDFYCRAARPSCWGARRVGFAPFLSAALAGRGAPLMEGREMILLRLIHGAEPPTPRPAREAHDR